MIKIIAIDSCPLALPVRDIYAAAAGFLEDRRFLIVRLEVEDGIDG